MSNHDSLIELKESIGRGKVTALVGARFSVAAGLPDWRSLIGELASRIRYKLPPQEWVTSDALSDAIQAYLQAQGAHSLISFLRDRLSTVDKEPTAAHFALAQLPINTIFTTNYDNLLELACREIGKQVQVIVSDSSIPYMSREPDTLNLVKLYGDLDQPSSVLLARQPSESLAQQQTQMLNILEIELGRSNMLYVGLSHLEPQFSQLFGELMARRQESTPTGYAMMCELSQTQQHEMERNFVRSVALPSAELPMTELVTWLKELAPTPLPNTHSSQKRDEGELRDRHVGPTAAATRKISVVNRGQAWALLVGINRYQDSRIAGLKAATGDVTALSQLLAGNYQAVRLLTDETLDRLPTRANILGALSTVAQAAEADDLLLFHFSGHGIAEGGESYLLPQDAQLSALRHTAIAMVDVRQVMEQSRARAKVIILDACHSGASIGRATPMMTPEFIKRVFEQAQGFVVLASCTQGQYSWEWPEKGHGVFTYYLLEALRGKADVDEKGFVTVSDVSRYVTNGVKQWSVENNAPQTPTLESRVAGDIILLHQHPTP